MVKSQTSLIHGQGGGMDRGWMKFDVTGIPVGSTINNVVIKYWVSSENAPYYQIRRLEFDPVVASGTTLWNGCANGPLYLYITNYYQNWNTRSLGGTINTDLQNALASGWFALAMYENETNSAYWFYMDGWNQTHVPYLEVSYSTNYMFDIGVDSITSPHNLSCEAIYPVNIRLINTGTSTLTSATINWWVNNISQATVNWTGSMVSGANTSVTLGNYSFSPGNSVITAEASSPNGQYDQFTNNNSRTNIVQIIPKPNIYLEPVDQNISPGSNATFSVISAGGNITYQWQVSTDNAQTFNDLYAVPPYSNVTSNILHITACTQDMNGYKYRCVVTGICPPQAVSDTVMLNIGPPVRALAGTGFTCPGGSAQIPITVQNLTLGTGLKLTLTYNQLIANYLSYSGLNPLLAGSFTVINTPGQVVIQWAGTTPVTFSNEIICLLSFSLTNSCPLVFDTILSNHCQFIGFGGVAFLAHYSDGALVNGIPSIIQQPDNLLAVQNVPASFRVTAGGLLTYQWQISTTNGSSWVNLTSNTVYQGVNDDTLRILSPTLSMTGYRYRCALTGCGSTIYTNQNTPPDPNGALLTVIKLVKTWVDTTFSCPCATPHPQILIPIKVANFDSISSASLSLLYKCTALQYIGYQNVHPNLPSFTVINNSFIPEAPAACVNGMVRIASINFTGTFSIPDNENLVVLKFNVLCDTTRLQWETWTAGACQYSTGLTTFEAQFKNGFVLNGGPVITSQPASPPLVFTGDTTTISTSAVTYGGPVISYQWQESTNGGTTWNDLSNSSIYIGVTTGTLRIVPTLVSMNGYKYRCKISGLCSPVYTNVVTISVALPPVYINIPQVMTCSGDTILVPVIVTNFKQACSFSMVLTFDNSKLTFISAIDKNPGLNNLSNFLIVPGTNTVTLSWNTTIPTTLTGAATLIKLRYVTSQLFANSPLTWVSTPAGTCHINNCNAPPGNVISSLFSNSAVSVNPLPQSHNVITNTPAGGHFCSGTNGAPVGIDITQSGVNYSLYRDGNAVPGYTNIPGTGFGYTFGMFTTPGHYLVLAVNPVTGCSKWMDSFVDIIADPTLSQFTVTGGGSYCEGGVGQAVGLSGSQVNIDYTLFLGNTAVSTLPGTGSALNFGTQTAEGIYSIIAKYSGFETCPTTMNGNVSVILTPFPGTCGPINGTTPVCQGPVVVIYTVFPIVNTTGYIWTLPPGATGTSTTNTIQVTFPSPAANSGNITVKAHNVCGDGAPSTLPVVVNPLPAAPGPIAGPATVCQGQQNVVYSIANIQDALTNTWTLPNSGIGWSMVSTTGNTVTLNVGTNAQTGTLSVKGHNNCGDGPVASLIITVNPLPAGPVSITGNSIPCQGKVYTYSTPYLANATSYNWTLPPGATGSSTTQSITVTYSVTATSGNITVNGSNVLCGAGGSFSLPVTLSPLPMPAGTLSGPGSVCKGTQGVVYSLPVINFATSYTWTLPLNVTGNLVSSAPSNTLNFTPSATSGNISVKGTNGCGDGTAFTLPVTVNPLPVVSLADFPQICAESGGYTLVGGQPAGGTYSGPGVTAGIFYPVITGSGSWNIVYTYTDANSCTNSATKTIMVVQFPGITGLVTYNNTPQTPLGQVHVLLKNASNVTIDSTVTQTGSGSYSFKCLANGTYNLTSHTSIPWAGSQSNAIDALLVARAAVGLITLSSLQVKAGDVNNSGSLNAVDALLILRRFVGLTSSFSIADWQFETIPPAVINSGSVIRNVKAICAGDVDGSYVPPGVK
ncbi:MAG: hypothetical protein NTU44_17435 [Bacteroidetes bacterium]|nr:hypothetical protein [Bacteroidota bacterium]